MAGWPTLTLLMSDSPKATVMVIVLVFTISASPVLVLVLAEPVVEVDPEEVDDEDESEDVELPEAPDDEPADTESPGEMLSREMIVPLVGAYSFVSASAFSALFTPACALATDASAEAMLAAEVVEVVVVEVVVVELVPVLLAEEPSSAVLSSSSAAVRLSSA